MSTHHHSISDQNAASMRGASKECSKTSARPISLTFVAMDVMRPTFILSHFSRMSIVVGYGWDRLTAYLATGIITAQSLGSFWFR